MSFLRYHKYRHIILSSASETIEKLEKEISESGYFTISCKDDLMKRISDEIVSYKDDFSKFESTYDELIKISMRMITTNSFELFETDIYRVMGVVNWSGPARTARQLHSMMIKHALERGYITQEDADEDADALKQVIDEGL